VYLTSKKNLEQDAMRSVARTLGSRAMRICIFTKQLKLENPQRVGLL
jgi:hypothetical protein